MDDPSRRPWATGLPPAAAAAIVSRLPCSVDRGTMAAVCRPWRSLALATDCPAALPWIILPGAKSTRLHCFLSNYSVHHHILGPPHGSRYFGSHEGAWLFLAYGHKNRDHGHVHELVNLLDGNRVHALPDTVQSELGSQVIDMLAATVSAPPDDPNCVGACIIAPGESIPALRCFAFWRMGSGSAVAFDFSPGTEPPETAPGQPSRVELEVEDVVHHQGAFHFLTRGEHVFVCKPDLGEGGQMLLVPQLNLFEQSGARDYGELVVCGRYLVVSGADLLMVVRLSNHDQLMTSGFRVFRMMPEQIGCLWSWCNMDTLGGRMLFVGRGCSRSYQVDEHPGLTAGIFFLDDHAFHDGMGLMFRDANERQYPCIDNGSWSEGRIQYFLTEDSSSRCSPAVWLLPRIHPPRLPTDMVVLTFTHSGRFARAG